MTQAVIVRRDEHAEPFHYNHPDDFISPEEKQERVRELMRKFGNEDYYRDLALLGLQCFAELSERWDIEVDSDARAPWQNDDTVFDTAKLFGFTPEHVATFHKPNHSFLRIRSLSDELRGVAKALMEYVETALPEEKFRGENA